MENQTSPRPGERKPRKPYSKPEIIHELELETRAGSPLPDNNGDFLDLTGAGEFQP